MLYASARLRFTNLLSSRAKEKALPPSRELVVETIRVNMFLMTPYTLDSPSIIDAESY